MKIIGLITNLTGVLATLCLFIIYFANIGSVSLIGGDNGPTTLFLTAKMNYGTLLIAFFFFLVFVFNVCCFARRKPVR